MSDLITSQMLSDWRANYGLDKRTPIKAMHWWQDNMDGKAPAGVVAALGLCINEIERLTAERDELRRQLAEAEQRFDWLTGRLEDVQIDNTDPNAHYHGDEEDVPYPVLWRRAIDAAMGGGDAG